MRCKVCKTELALDAPIYRMQLWENHPMIWAARSGDIMRLCEACWSTKPDPRYPFSKDRRTWYAPKPCAACGRPVIMCNRRRMPELLCCSIECEGAARNAVARRKRRSGRAERTCDGCGKPFEPKRIDATFCSPACRQRGYRQRHAIEM